MNQANVLVLTDDAEFSRALLSRWQQERVIPAFTVKASDAVSGPTAPGCDLAVVGGIRGGRLTPVLKALDAASRPTICVCGSAESLRLTFPRLQFLSEVDGWEDPLVVLATETLRRLEAVQRARRAEQLTAKLQHQAALGQYMSSVRHSLNNALTSVLGNAELLLLEPERFAPEVREQIETIHAMSLKIHEILFRFSSLETEMQVVEKQSQSETGGAAAAAAVGA